MGLPKKQLDVLAKLLPSYSGKGGIRHCLQTLPELQKLPIHKEPCKSLFSLAERLEGLPHQHSAHPSGIILGDEHLARTIPLQHRPNGEPTTPFTKDDIKATGLLKIDLLGLRNLTVIHDTLASIRERTGRKLTLGELPLDDPQTFRTIGGGNTLGCFQLESMGIRQLLRRMRPQSISHLGDLLALYRPGAWNEGIVKTYLRRHRGEETFRVVRPEMAPVLSQTYGLILYQEQVMAIAQAVTGCAHGGSRLAPARAFRRIRRSAVQPPKAVCGGGGQAKNGMIICTASRNWRIGFRIFASLPKKRKRHLSA